MKYSNFCIIGFLTTIQHGFYNNFDSTKKNQLNKKTNSNIMEKMKEIANLNEQLEKN